MTAREQRVIACASVVADRWDEMMKRPTGDATRADARALIQLVTAVKRLRSEQRGAAR